VYVRKVRTRSQPESQSCANGTTSGNANPRTSFAASASNASTVEVPRRNNNTRPSNLPPPVHPILLDQDDESQFADSINQENSNGSGGLNHTHLNQIVIERLKEIVGVKDAVSNW